MKLAKKWLSIVCAMAMLLSGMTVPALAAEKLDANQCYGYFFEHHVIQHIAIQICFN